MEENTYRASRLCRLLGNPVAFSIVVALMEGGEMTPREIAGKVGRSVARTSSLLAALRLAEVVRYETHGGRTRYRLKYPSQVGRVMKSLAAFVKASSRHEGNGLSEFRKAVSSTRSLFHFPGSGEHQLIPTRWLQLGWRVFEGRHAEAFDSCAFRISWPN